MRGDNPDWMVGFGPRGRGRGGRCRLGCVVGPISSSPRGPCHLTQWPTKITEKIGQKQPWRGSLRAQRGAMSRSVVPGVLCPLRVSVIRFARFGGLRKPLHPNEDRTDHRREMLGQKPLRRPVSPARWGTGQRVLAPGPKTPAGGLTKLKNNVPPLLRLLETGSFCLGTLRLLQFLTLDMAIKHIHIWN